MRLLTDQTQTATLFPGLLFSLVFILNLFVWAQASSTAIPFGTLIGLVALWLLIQVPLVYVGSWYGFFKASAWEHPTKTNSIARQIPPRPWYLQNYQGILVAGLIPFAVLFIELLFVFKSLWQDKSGYYYVFGFLSVVSIILVITVAEVTIIATYVQLCHEVRRPYCFTSYQLTSCRIITGGGRASSLAVPAPSGSSFTASGTISPAFIFKALSPVCFFSATVSWLAPCTGC